MSFRIEHVTLTHACVPLVEPFVISSGAVSEKDGIVVRLESQGASGWGESSPMSGSFYSSDTPESCWQELTGSLIPSLFSQEFDSIEAAKDWVNGASGGNFAKVGVETALWDLEARLAGKPLCELLGGAPAPVASGLAVGLYDAPAQMLKVIERHLADGYKRVKIKIERGRDVELVKAVREAFGSIPLYVDANGAYDLTDLEIFRQLDDFGLMMFEQPFAGSQLEALAELQRRVRTPVCLDESLESVDDLHRAIDLGSFRIANIKIQRVGGFTHSLEILHSCRAKGIPCWMGTMPELGVGSAQAIALAAVEGCVFPTDVESSLRWFVDDIVEPVITVRDGTIDAPRTPGMGYEVDSTKLARYAVRSLYF